MFSVIIPVHNKLPHLDRSIQSVLQQSYTNFELIIIDDASTDGSSDKIKQYNDPRIRHFKRDTPGPGGYAARNLGIREAKNEWIAFLDADDEWDRNYLMERKVLLNSNSNVELIASNYYSSTKGVLSIRKGMDNLKTPIFEFNLTDYLNFYWLVWTGAVSIKKELLIKIGLFPEGKCTRGGDLDVWIKSLYLSSESIFINKTLSTYYRDTINQVTNRFKNPPKKVCSMESLEKIRKETTSVDLLKAIDNFLSIKFYEILKSNKMSASEKKSILNKIHSKRIRIKIRTKLILREILVFAGILEKLKS